MSEIPAEIPAVTDHYRKYMFEIIARSYKFCDVQLLCSLICITLVMHICITHVMLLVGC